MQWNWNVWCSLGRICSLHFRSGWPASYFCGTQTLCCSCTGPTSVQLIAQLNSTQKDKYIRVFCWHQDCPTQLVNMQKDKYIRVFCWHQDCPTQLIHIWPVLKVFFDSVWNWNIWSMGKVPFIRLNSFAWLRTRRLSPSLHHTDIEWHKDEITMQENFFR